MQLFQQFSLSAKTRGLLLVTFITLTLTALSFLYAIYSLDYNNRKIFNSVENNVERSSSSSDLYRMLVELEMDIRDLITVIVREPYKLTSAKESLKNQFTLIQQKAELSGGGPEHKELLKQLRWYKASLNGLMRDYGALNSTLYEVYFYINNIKEQLIYLEETAGQLMVELATEGRKTDAVQQTYVLISIVYEKMLQVHILVNSSVTNYDTVLLGADDTETTLKHEDTVLGKIRLMGNTLRTLTVAEEEIASYALSVQEIIPLLEDNVIDLSIKLNRLNDRSRLFVLERKKIMGLLDDMVDKNRFSLLNINSLIDDYSKQTRLIAWVISIAVVLISLIGLLLTRKMSQQLEHTAKEALLAREAGEHLNKQLQQEVNERKIIGEDLARARDELEQRVKERTAELSTANRGLALEIEERKNAEFALAQEKEQLSVTLRSIGDGVITTSLDGKIVLLNRVAEDMTGWQQDEAVGKSINEVFRTQNRLTGDPCENPVDCLLHDGAVYYNLAEDKALISRDGSQFDISDSCAPITDKDSNVIGAVLVFRDVADKRRMQDEALKSEKLKSVGILAGGIAHDFNNILAAIVGNISLTKLQLDKEKNEQAFKLLKGAEKASLRARDLTQQLLTFSKGGEPVRKVEAISEIIRESAEFILSGGKIHCEYLFEEDLWPVRIDTGQISQVVQNIIINSMHAMPLGGKIFIRCSNVDNKDNQIPSMARGEFVKISIKDEGPGIPKELQDRIFDPYFTTKAEGSGLGLALTHSIVTKHQGYIEMNSGDWGTEFILYLPALPGSILEKSEEFKVDSHSIHGNILIMDDEVMIRDIAGDLLTHLGFDVTTVSNGEEAVGVYRERLNSKVPFDAVIMDLTIPGGMGGKDAIQKLLDIDPNVKGIVSSGYSNDPVMAEYERYGFVGMVHKPFEVEELLQILHKVIGPKEEN